MQIYKRIFLDMYNSHNVHSARGSYCSFFFLALYTIFALEATFLELALRRVICALVEEK